MKPRERRVRFCRILVRSAKCWTQNMRMDSSSIDWIVASVLAQHPTYMRTVDAGGAIFRPGDPIWMWDNRPFGISKIERARTPTHASWRTSALGVWLFRLAKLRR